MKYTENGVKDIKIAYIGGGSRGWAWGLMSDLVSNEDMSGRVDLYDIDLDAAKANEIIGNKYNSADGSKSHWDYRAVETIGEALTDADFVVISILPGTFDEMESDVHEPEKYGIYQAVGDTAGPGGIVRAMRCVPMYEFFAKNIEKYCPNAWVLNYTNPMTLCVKTLYRVFPKIKAFGCCHEVFGTQKLLCEVVKQKLGETVEDRTQIKVNPIGVNHFTWLTEATYKNTDLFPYYREFCVEKKEGVSGEGTVDANWMNSSFESDEKVKIDLFNKFGYIAAAGDRHLAEFCEGKWYLENPERVREMHFGLTSVDWRKNALKERLEKSQKLVNGEENIVVEETGEEGVEQMRALLGLRDLVTNVNIPNYGQIPNLPIGAVVETNAVFRADSLVPVFAGNIPTEIHPLISRACTQQELVSEAIAERDFEKAFIAFINDPLVTCSMDDARTLFDTMCQNTKKYLQSGGWDIK